MVSTWFRIEGINPQPWTAPEGAVVRKGGKTFVQMHKATQLDTYQKALAEVVMGHPSAFQYMEGQLELDVWFWRQIEWYRNDQGRKVVKHRADRSNLLKAFEDALQGILYKNDNQIVAGTTTLIEQGQDMEPLIVARLSLIGEGFTHQAGRYLNVKALLDAADDHDGVQAVTL